MRNRGSIFRFVTACTVCFAIIGYSVYAFLFAAPTGTAPLSSGAGGAAGRSDISRGEDTHFSDPPSGTESEKAEETSSGADQTQSVPAAAAGTAKGKVIAKYFSPYSAKDAYNNTYVKNSTGTGIDIKGLLAADLSFKIKKSDEPQVLILHTHTTECFMTEDRDYYTDADVTRSLDEQNNIVRVGDAVANKLAAAGIKAVHAKEKHDYPEYNGSYTRAAQTIGRYLKKYPTIKVVIDLHRDAIASGETDKVKPVTEINGKKAAQVMIVMGSQTGSVTNFPDWQENLKLALRLQQTIEVMYPTLARPLSLMSRNYNESLTKGSMLIEFGTDASTIDEAVYSGEMVGDALASLLNTLQ